MAGCRIGLEATITGKAYLGMGLTGSQGTGANNHEGGDAMTAIIWTCGWFVTLAVCEYLDAKTRAIEGRDHRTAKEHADAGKVEAAIWGLGLIFAFLS